MNSIGCEASAIQQGQTGNNIIVFQASMPEDNKGARSRKKIFEWHLKTCSVLIIILYLKEILYSHK